MEEKGDIVLGGRGRVKVGHVVVMMMNNESVCLFMVEEF